MKTCKTCKESKKESQFPVNGNGLRTECKLCHSARYRAIYQNDPNIREKHRKRRKERKAFLNSLKEPCVICGESDPVVIDFHHIDPSTKTAGVTDLRNCKNETIIAEVQKCVCLCANCHRRVHAGTVEIPTQT
jgi:hypothetical protein